MKRLSPGISGRARTPAPNLNLICRSVSFLPLDFRSNAHTVERAIHKEERDQEKQQCESPGQWRVLRGEFDSEFHRQKPEERCELDYGVHCYRRRVFERVSYCVADHR